MKKKWRIPRVTLLFRRLVSYLRRRKQRISLQVLLLGPKGAGKTTYLARYYQYLREYLGEPWHAFAEEENSRRYLEKVLEALQKGELSPTEEPVPLYITTMRKKESSLVVAKIHTYDLPGGVALPEKLLHSCDALLVMISPFEISSNLSSELELVFLKLKAEERLLPVGFVLTKLDHPNSPIKLQSGSYERLKEEAEFFVKEKLPSLYKLISQSFPIFFFSISSFGDWQEVEKEGKTRLIPDFAKPPLGIHLPMEWICETLWQQKKGQKLLFFLLALGGLLLLLLILLLLLWIFKGAG